ncbi:hypothetical protein ABT160_02030 [Streptomyces sp. NPDC001941]|uniref:hypothetical protein n=1 Tax=Streptomyces sp. NPDC001941 TaxID=3154659 RepID=UPI00331F8495
MTHREPAGTLAPHIPAEIYRQAEREGRTIIVVHPAPPPAAPARSGRAWLWPVGIGFAVALGLIGTAAAVLALIEFATHTAALLASTAGPIGLGGITLKLARPKTK